MINEFSDRRFPCAQYVPAGPGYEDVPLSSKICSQKGAVAGQDYVDGDAFINTSYRYFSSHLWRNYGIILGFFFFFLAAYIICSELVRAKPSKGEILVFPRGKIPAFVKKSRRDGDLEGARPSRSSSLIMRVMTAPRQSSSKPRSSTGKMYATTSKSKERHAESWIISMDGSSQER